MRNIQLILPLWLAAFTVYGQICSPPQSQIDINGNNIRARVLNRGDLFTDGSNAQFIPNYNASSPADQPSTIFSAGLWMGGLDANNNLAMAASTYRQQGKSDYWAGPLDNSGLTSDADCANWDRHFLVKKTEVDAFLAALPTITQAQALTQFPSIMGWPGKGNPFFVDIHGFELPFNTLGLAPFFDENNDGLYDPMKGDYPVVALRGQDLFVPAEQSWCVFNDQGGGAVHSISQGKSIGMEIQQTVWAMNSDQHPVLNNTIFTSHKLLYRGLEALDSFSIGMWVDFDLGCYADDYIGCNPALNTFFAYNTDAVDGDGTNCQNIPSFTDSIPVQSVTYLSHSLDKFMATGATTPTAMNASTTPQYYRLLNGQWAGGQPLTYGGSGIGGATPTDHAFSGDPADANGWSMCTTNMPAMDRRALGSTKVGELLPGMIEQVVMAWSVHFGGTSPCNLGNTFSDVEDIIDVYNNGFSSTVRTVEASQIEFSITPNPAFDKIWLNYGDADVREIRIFDLSGQLMQSVTNHLPQQMELQIAHLPTGLYVVQILGKSGIGVQKLAVAR